MHRLLLALIAALFAAGGLPLDAAGQGRPSGSAVIVGTVRDAAGGRPVARTHVCAGQPQGTYMMFRNCVTGDTDAAFRLDGLPSGTWRILVECERGPRVMERLLEEDVEVAKGERVERHWEVDSAACDPRPLRRITRIFEGYYSVGFEHSEFIPCVADAWFEPSDSLWTGGYDNRRAWVSLPVGTQLPFTLADEQGNPRYYAHWHGTVEGPGSYGHLSASAFRLEVDSVIEIRAPEEGDCRPLHGDVRVVRPRPWPTIPPPGRASPSRQNRE